MQAGWPGIIVGIGLMLSGCQQRADSSAPVGQPTFHSYQQQTRNWVATHRAFQTLEKEDELRWNTPQEWRPTQGSARKGIVLVHGLGDSPGSFSDIGPALAAQGFVVRTVLLPGHGTRPADMLNVSVDDWRQVVREQSTILAQEVDALYIGGFSTGGNLALEYAMQHPEVQGVLLFSPALKSSTGYDFLAPALSLFRDWLRPPGEIFPQQIATRYLRVPTNGFAQFWHTSAAVQALLKKQPYDKPVLLVLSEHDSVLDTRWILNQFDAHFTHPNSRVIWYGSPPPALAQHSRVLVRADYLPKERISQFSHMSVLFSPANPVYGRQGRERLCANGQDDVAARACLNGDEVWYSDWGFHESGKIHARLTWNPWFSWQTSVIKEVLRSG